MILTVTLNAALDKTHLIPDFRLGCVNRPAEALVMAGGKGINVARALRTLGEPALATGLLAGYTGAQIAGCLDAEGLAHAFHRLEAGESRTCLAVVGAGACPTEINEAGPLVSAGEFACFLARFDALLPAASHVALSGSLPPGLDPGAYLALIARARAAGVGVSLDTSGPALRQALAGRPDVAKPNQAEAEAVLGAPITPETLPGAVQALLACGPALVALSLGEHGAVVATADEAVFLTAPRVAVVSPVGSGDAFLAALLCGLRRGQALSEAARLAVAAGSANAAVAGPAACLKSEIDALLPFVGVHPLAESPWALGALP